MKKVIGPSGKKYEVAIDKRMTTRVIIRDGSHEHVEDYDVSKLIRLRLLGEDYVELVKHAIKTYEERVEKERINQECEMESKRKFEEWDGDCR